ncbi:cobaltochelatase subunit CobN [Roseospira navarrensis]|uniref:Cobaltochelatase subunit CobN n=1 Tax=Roseospira navarrensis TaxID=140058 RepID=A0A7X1ZDL1_9PROT|nr:cobaltochelatase subunit CobN [Roseospira navarrensis]MQX35265.1 cobaltochelatase subunit CobN [Roseospira navarrensis]
MHLLAATPGVVSDGSEAVDLGQDPADVVILTAADTEIAGLSAARARLGPGAPSLRLANLTRLGHNYSVDLYADAVLRHARLIVVRLLGGRAYWPYGVETIVALARETGARVALLPGDANPDPDLAEASNVPASDLHRLWQYLVHGGVDNAEHLLRRCADLLETPGFADWREPTPLPPAGRHGPAPAGDRPVAALVFYRALAQAGDMAVVEALHAALAAEGLDVLAVHVTSLKDPVAAALLSELLAETPPAVILNLTGFAVATGHRVQDSPFAAHDVPVLQAALASSSAESWREGAHGLIARDIAMSVTLPEVDGRVFTRAVSFKGLHRWDEAAQVDVTGHVPEPDRVAFVAALCARWVAVRRTPPGERRVALMLANYPNKDGRLGNGVGLDTPAGTVEVLRALATAGYRVEGLPADGAALMDALKAGPTNALEARAARTVRVVLPLETYRAALDRLPEAARAEVSARWGDPADDPSYLADRGGFALSMMVLGHVAVGIQPARGYHIDPVTSYHDPALVPPHGYLAVYIWIREVFGAHAVVHMGKHGNMEWLPGKSLALSESCWPEAVFGPLPHLYPFIVNDPGEGTQAKRRAQAVIVDHLTPPLTRAESYGPLRDLERLVDEYHEAAGVDPRRLVVLREEILSLAESSGLAADLGLPPPRDLRAEEGASEALAALDNHLCELKELQIRDGLHVFGVSPEGDQRTDLLVALARPPRGDRPEQASLTRALAQDLCLWIAPGTDGPVGDMDERVLFDPLETGDLGRPWTGPRPAVLADLCRTGVEPPSGTVPGGGETSARQEGRPRTGPRPAGMDDVMADPWRTAGDTVERLEALARALVSGAMDPDPAWTATRAVLDHVRDRLAPAVEACGRAEIAGLLAGLDGRFVPPGPSGAPTRGKPEVLPTGRNFFSVDSRRVPTPAAWTLGWRSASLLIERHVMDHGDWPRAVALSAWGTANMRTGGEDIAQALALMGARPRWEPTSGRVIGFEILPLSVLDRPRVDVTLRISGFFRDAFPAQVDLVDSAARAVAALEDEGEDMNPLAARVRAESARLEREGAAPDEARRRAGHRVFGSRPGAYGAGLQALIDEQGWETDADLAAAYVAWGGYAYGDGAAGQGARDLLESRLSQVDAVLHNQDNREHDLLDSDDYYQFEGGLTAAVRTLSGRQPAVYHSDHSRPESPRVRTLDEEIARVVRARAANPKWIRGVMRHDYKGAFEIAATVDYLFAFAATARCVKSHHFDLLFDAYLEDPEVRDFMADVNPDALREMAARFQEALDRGLWTPRRNDTGPRLASLLT